MSFPFQRRASSPRAPDYDGSSSSPRRSPFWKGKGSKNGFDVRRIVTLAGVIILLVIVISYISKFFSGTGVQKDPFIVQERSANTKYDIYDWQ